MHAKDMVVYRVGWENAGTHRFDVRIDFPAGFQDLIFPSWAPGSYLQREFARNVRDIHALAPDGTPVEVRRLSRNEWKAVTDGPFRLHYQVYAREKSVRTPFLDESLAFFVPTNLLVFARNHRQAHFELRVQVPVGHLGVCPLGPSVEGPAEALWQSEDIDQLYDSPVAVGPFEYRRFESGGIAHHHYIEPGHDGNLDQLSVDLQKIVEAAAKLFGGAYPYPAYTFISLLTRDGHGGLEHLDSSVLLRPRRGFPNRKNYEEFLTLAAHEHFHAWNVKRIRPDTLSAPFPYERESYTRNLWWLEGGTVYYEERIALRAGVINETRHYERLCDLVKRLDRVPGRLHQSMEDSSFDAWIKLYRPGEDSNNSGVSYYLKGAVVIWAMDLEILHRSGGTYGVDDLLRGLWEEYASKGLPFPEEQTIERMAAELAGGGDWGRWWDHHLRGTAEILLAEALSHVGLELVRSGAGTGGWLGIETSGDRVMVSSVREDGPSNGILTPGDEILALDGERVLGGDLATRLADLPPGTTLRVLLSRDGRILERPLTLGRAPATEVKLLPRTDADARQLALRARWLGVA